MKLTDSEWAVMEALWTAEEHALGEITDALKSVNGWNKNTVLTYLTRMEKKGIVSIDRGSDKPYSAAVTKEECAREKRQELLNIKDKTPQVENEIKNLNYQINNIILTFKYSK